MTLEQHDYYTMRQLEKILQMTRKTIKAEIDAGKLVPHVMGKRVRFRDDNVKRYIDGCEVTGAGQ